MSGSSRVTQHLTTVLEGGYLLDELKSHVAVRWVLDVRRHGIESANRRADRRAELVAGLFALKPGQLR